LDLRFTIYDFGLAISDLTGGQGLAISDLTVGQGLADWDFGSASGEVISDLRLGNVRIRYSKVSN
jgi:hypothetical protein